MTSTKPSAGKGPRAALKRLWRAITKNFIARLLCFIIVLIAWTYLSDDEMGGMAARFSGLFVIVLLCVSYVYMRIVAPRVFVRIPGLDQNSGAELKPNAATDAQEHESEVTLQVLRLDSQSARITIANDSPLPVLRAEASLVLARDDGGEAAEKIAATKTRQVPLSLAPHSAVPASLTQAFSHVGIYRLQSLGMRVYDLFGAFSRLNLSDDHWRIRVIPNIYRIAYGVPTQRKVRESDLGIPNHTADALDYVRVRDWRPGDPLKTIHWKLVAHSQGELYTKLFETSTTTKVLLQFDPYGYCSASGSVDEALHLYDTMLEGGLSLLEHARQNGIVGELRFLGRSGSTIRAAWAGPGMRGWFVESASLPLSSVDTWRASVRDLQVLREDGAGYVIFATSRLSERSVEELITCHHAGVPLLVVHALPTGSGQEAQQQRRFDEHLRGSSIAVVALTDGHQIIREVTSS